MRHCDDVKHLFQSPLDPLGDTSKTCCDSEEGANVNTFFLLDVCAKRMDSWTTPADFSDTIYHSYPNPEDCNGPPNGKVAYAMVSKRICMKDSGVAEIGEGVSAGLYPTVTLMSDLPYSESKALMNAVSTIATTHTECTAAIHKIELLSDEKYGKIMFQDGSKDNPQRFDDKPLYLRDSYGFFRDETGDILDSERMVQSYQTLFESLVFSTDMRITFKPNKYTPMTTCLAVTEMAQYNMTTAEPLYGKAYAYTFGSHFAFDGIS